MAPKPVAKGYCEECGTFFIWDRSKLYVLMNERPNPPEIISSCPNCDVEIRSVLTFKDASIFNDRGVPVKHTYDDGSDIQPLTEEDVRMLEENLDLFLNSIQAEG